MCMECPWVLLAASYTLSGLSIALLRRSSYYQLLGYASLVSAWLGAILYGPPRWGPSGMLYVIAMGVTLASILDPGATTAFSGAIASGAMLASIYINNPIIFILGIEASIIACYGALILTGREGDRSALVFFFASSTAVILLALGLFAQSNYASRLLLLTGILLELSIAPLHLWGVDVAFSSALPAYLAAFTAPKIPVIQLLFTSLLDSDKLVLLTATGIAAFSAIVGSLTGVSGGVSPRKALAYGSVVHLSIPIFLLGRPSNAVLAFYLASYVLGEAGLVAIIHGAEQGGAKPGRVPGILVALLVSGIVGVPPASLFFAKIAVLVHALSSKTIGILAIASLVVSTPLITIMYLQALTRLLKTPWATRPSITVLLFSSTLLVALSPLVPLR